MSLHPEAGGPGPMMYRPRRKEPPMSDLENEYLKEALEWYDEDAGQVLPGSVPHERIVDAARRLLNLTSPETITDELVEAGAKGIYDIIDDLRAEDRMGGPRTNNAYWSMLMSRAVLEAGVRHLKEKEQ